MLPGKIWHLEVTRSVDGRHFILETALKTTADFQEVLVAPDMLRDHFPNHVMEALELL